MRQSSTHKIVPGGKRHSNDLCCPSCTAFDVEDLDDFVTFTSFRFGDGGGGGGDGGGGGGGGCYCCCCI